MSLHDSAHKQELGCGSKWERSPVRPPAHLYLTISTVNFMHHFVRDSTHYGYTTKCPAIPTFPLTSLSALGLGVAMTRFTMENLSPFYVVVPTV